MSGNERAPAPQNAPAPAIDVISKQSVPMASPKSEGSKTLLETTQLASAVLRDAAARAFGARHDRSPSRKATLVAAVGTLTSAFRALETINDEQRRIDFSKVDHEVKHVGYEAQLLEEALASEHLDGIQSDLHQQIFRFANTVEQVRYSDDIMTIGRRHELAEWLRTKMPWPAATSSRLSAKEQLQLCRQALGGASEMAERIKNASSDELKTSVASLCLPIPLELGIAAKAALSIENLQMRGSLTVVVENVNAQLKRVAQLLKMAEQPWKPVFAEMFDGMNQVRRAIGLGDEAWPYTGTINPEQAVDRIRGVTKGDGSNTNNLESRPASDPQVAVNTIAIGLRHINERQQLAITHLTGHLREPPPPRPPSFLDVALEIATSVAMTSVAGAIASRVSQGLRSALENGARMEARRLVADAARIGKDAAEKTRVMDHALKGGELYRVMAVDTAKDAVKTFFKDGMSQALKATTFNSSNSGDPRTAYLEHQTLVLKNAGQQAELLMAHLAPVLGKVELDVLNQLSRDINGSLVQAAYDQQYDSSLREWLNLKVKLSGGRELDPKGRDVSLDKYALDGVLEAMFEIDAGNPTGSARPKSMILRGGEHRAIARLKQAKIPLDKVGIHVKYIPRFVTSVGPEITLPIGVGPDLGIQTPAKPDLQLLKVVASKLPLTPEFVIGAFRGQYDHVTDAAAMAVAKQLVSNMAFISTVWLED